MVAFESNADILVPIQNINESQHYENHQHPSFLRCKFGSHLLVLGIMLKMKRT